MAVGGIRMELREFLALSHYKKIHFSIVLESGRNLNFKRHAYLPIHFEKNKLVLLHYLGDESIAVDYHHYNRRLAYM